MRIFDRTVSLSLGSLLISFLAPSAVKAQTPQDQQYPTQQYPTQQYPAQQYPAQQSGSQPAPPQPSAPPQAYPQQQAYPQPGYPQAYPQQPGYPQAYPQQPGYPQAYPQQPGYPQAYPPQPGYPAQAAPPPAYPPPPPAYQPQPEQPNPVPAYRRGLVFLPYLGINTVVGTGSDAYSTGFHLGGLLGGHIGPSFSLNGEMSIDVMNPNGSGSEVLVDFTFSPLFHFGFPYVEFVVGPKLGFFADAGSIGDSYYGGTTDFNGFGVAYGFTAGAFFPLGRMAIGGLLNFTGHSFSEHVSLPRTNQRYATIRHRVVTSSCSPSVSLC